MNKLVYDRKDVIRTEKLERMIIAVWTSVRRQMMCMLSVYTSQVEEKGTCWRITSSRYRDHADIETMPISRPCRYRDHADIETMPISVGYFHFNARGKKP